MDALSAFLSLYTPGGNLDVRCHLHAPWALEHEPGAPGVAAYHVIVDGDAVLDIPGRASMQLHAGDIVVLPHGSAHRLQAGHCDASWRPPVDERNTGNGIRLKTNAGNGAVSDILCGSFVFDQPAGQGLLATLPEVLVVHTAARSGFASLRALIAMLRIETEEHRPGAEALISHLSSVLFGMLIRAWTDDEGSILGLLGALSARRLQPALLAMFSDTARNWTLAELAQLCHMSRATFTRLFLKAAHITVAAALLQIRMTRAAQSLARDDHPVSTIGEAVGYQSESAFSRVFKKSFGMGPGEYRRRFRRPQGTSASPV